MEIFYLYNSIMVENSLILSSLIKNQREDINLDKKLSFKDLNRISYNLNTSIFTNECSELKTNPSIYGIIHHYIHWGYSYESYLEDRLTEKNKNLDIIKVWCGR